MNKVALISLLVVLLAGCADTPSKQATIEDRGIKSDATKSKVEIVDANAKSMDGKPGERPGAGTSTSVTATPEEKVQTRGLAADATQVKSMDGKDAMSAGSAAGAGSDAAGAAAGAGASAGQGGGSAAVISLDLKDPQSPLAQRRLQFDYDSSAIRDEYRSLLEAHAQYLMKNSAAKAILQGNTDERGSREYNLALGQRRAESVFKALNLLGVPEGQLEAVSLGEEKPLVEGHDEAAWAQNRRVEILYQGE